MMTKGVSDIDYQPGMVKAQIDMINKLEQRIEELEQQLADRKEQIRTLPNFYRERGIAEGMERAAVIMEQVEYESAAKRIRAEIKGE